MSQSLTSRARRGRTFSIPHARSLVQDLLEHRPAIYFADALFSLVVGYGCALGYFAAPLGSLQQIVCFLVGGFALFRLGSFIHEVVHFRQREMRGFHVAWNLLAGIPMLMPSFLYGNHLDHHKAQHYGTGQDGEYLPLGNGPWRNIAYFYLQVVFLPLAVLLRFLVLTPISFLHPKLRRWVMTHASSFVINLRYQRTACSGRRDGWVTFLEIACFLRAAAIVVCPLVGLVPLTRWPQLYVFAMFVLGLNYVRNLVAHQYRSTGESMTHQEQLLDSVNIQGGRMLGGPITELFFPLGLRYHALHHLFPRLPYHNLGRAHRRLVEQLPADSPYHKTVYRSFWSRVGELLLDTRAATVRRPSGADLWYRRRSQLLKRRRRPDRRASGDPSSVAEVA